MIQRIFKKLFSLFFGVIIGAVGISAIGLIIVLIVYFTASEPVVREVPRLTPTPERTDPARTEELEIRPIDWQACDDAVVTESGFECGTVYVPLDYTDPTGTKLEIALIRYKAQSERKGVILYNPGGPGASGFNMVAWMGSYYVRELGLDEYDFVGFDPRGVERSNGLKCQSDAEIDKYQFGDASPDTPEEEAFYKDAYAAFVNGCQSKYWNTLQHYSTINTARDMDVIRAAMGDETISYLGVSYGTYLGAVYAHLYPHRVRAMVLDSAFEPNDDTVEEQYITQLAGFERAMNNWIAWCESEPTCAFNATDVGGRWDALYEQYNQQPVEASDGRMTYQSVILRATKSALYSESSWNSLADALANAEKGDVQALWTLVDSYFERSSEGTYRSTVHAFDIISCASAITYDDVPNPEELLAKMKSVAPRMSIDVRKESLESDSSCIDLMPVQSVAPVGYTGSAPILVIGGENDPATPLRWSEKMRDQMGENAVLLVYGGEGHGQVLQSDCVNRIAANALVQRTLPADNTRCEAQSTAVEPGWWANIPAPEPGEQFVSNRQVTTYIDIAPDAYATALIVPGLTDDIRTQMQQRLALRGFLQIDEGTMLDNGAYSVDYFIEGATVRMLVIGSDSMTDAAWAEVAQEIPAQQGLVVFMTKP